MSDVEPRGPWGMARDLEARIVELELERQALPRSTRRPINQHIHVIKGLLRWSKSRAGYIPPAKESVADFTER